MGVTQLYLYLTVVLQHCQHMIGKINMKINEGIHYIVTITVPILHHKVFFCQ